MSPLTVTEATTRLKKCTHCHSRYVSMYRYILKNGKDHAAVLIEAHSHNNELTAFFIVTLGMGKPKASSRTTFCCRYGYVESIDDFAFSLTDVPKTIEGSMTGRRLTRAQALKHPMLQDLWGVVDYLMDNDIVLHDFFNHTLKSKTKALFRLY